MVLEGKAAFPTICLLLSAGLTAASFDSHMRSKLLCGEDTHTLSQVNDTRPYRGVTRLDRTRGKKQVWRHRVRI